MWFRYAITSSVLVTMIQCADEEVCDSADAVRGSAMLQARLASGSVRKTEELNVDEAFEEAVEQNLEKSHLYANHTQSPVSGIISKAMQMALDNPAVGGKIPDSIKKVLTSPEFLANPMGILSDPQLKDVKGELLKVVKDPLNDAVQKIPPLAAAMKKLGKTPGDLIDELLECSTKTKCGDCTNGLSPCYWCSGDNTCHPIGSQQLKIAEADMNVCPTYKCQSQWPTSSCKSAYCPDGSSVGDDNGPCGGRLNCEACVKGKCFWCGISGSCHQIGSQFYDERCTEATCQATSWLSSCDSSDCSRATAYVEP